MFENLRYLVVGAGFSGAVIAERIATVLNQNVMVVDKRPQLGGNSASKIDEETGIEYHCYGPHAFHTANPKVWKYIQQFSDFTQFQLRVLTRCGGRVFFMPINLKTLNEFYERDLPPLAARELLCSEIATAGIVDPKNLEEKAISLIGEPLYRTFIAGYTQKQWGQSPLQLPENIITRLPVRTTFNTNYFDDPYQGMPKGGYFTLFKNLLSHPKIEVRLNTNFSSIKSYIPSDCKIIYTGMIDEFFDCCFGALEWRSLRFEWETLEMQDFQGTVLMNYGDCDVPYTRIHEYKHFHPERRAPFELNKTIICREYPLDYQSGREAYYPVNTEKNQSLLLKYQNLAMKYPNVIFCGRLGNYCYWNMDKTIEVALECFQTNLLNKYV